MEIKIPFRFSKLIFDIIAIFIGVYFCGPLYLFGYLLATLSIWNIRFMKLNHILEKGHKPFESDSPEFKIYIGDI